MVFLANQGQWPDSFCDFFIVMDVAFSYSNSFLLMDVEEDMLDISHDFRANIVADYHNHDIVVVNWLVGKDLVLVV